MRRVKVIWDKPIDIDSAILLNDEEDDYGITFRGATPINLITGIKYYYYYDE